MFVEVNAMDVNCPMGMKSTCLSEKMEGDEPLYVEKYFLVFYSILVVKL